MTAKKRPKKVKGYEVREDGRVKSAVVSERVCKAMGCTKANQFDE